MVGRRDKGLHWSVHGFFYVVRAESSRIAEYIFDQLTVEELAKANGKESTAETLEEEIAALSRGNPLWYDSYMGKTRWEMYLIVLGGRGG